MKQTILALGAITLALSGCKTMQVLDKADRAINTTDRVISTTERVAGTTNKTKRMVDGGKPESRRTNTVSKERFHITEAVRTSRDYGQIRHTTERNPKGMTTVILHGQHQDSGAKLVADAYLYKVTPEGWLVKNPVTVHDNGQKYLNSGLYYLKANSNEGDFITSGEIMIKKGVSNVVTVILE